MRQMTKEEWRAFLGDNKFAELEHLAENSQLLEAIEDVLCQQIRCDNVVAPGKAADGDGNFYHAVIMNNPPTVESDKLLSYLRSYAVGITAVQQAIRVLSTFKKSPERSSDSENPAI